MATTKVTATKPAAKAVAKETEVKTAVKEAAKKPVVKAAEKPATKKVAAKPAAKTTTKAAATKKAAAKAEVTVEFSGKSYTTDQLVKIAQDVWVYDLGHKAADMKTVDLYVKPEENVAYYVVNGEITGSFAL